MTSNQNHSEPDQTLPQQTPTRKPPRRFWLYAPYALVALAALGWSAGWWALSGRVKTSMDQTAADLRQAGYQVAWTSAKISGYPFRLDVTLSDVRLSEPSGWAVNLPELKTEAYVYSLDHLVLVAPQGATLNRPVAGGLRITAKGLRASLVQSAAKFPRLAIQGAGLGFTPEAGAQGFALASADKLELHLIPGGRDEAAVLFRIDGGKAASGGVTERIAAGKPVSVLWDATLSQRNAFKGRNWPDAVRHWTAAGGTMSLRQGGVTLGDTNLGLTSGRLSVGADGRLRGDLDVKLTRAPQALFALSDGGIIDPAAAQIAAAVIQARQSGQGDKAVKAKLSFEAGQTTLGPVALVPALKVY